MFLHVNKPMIMFANVHMCIMLVATVNLFVAKGKVSIKECSQGKRRIPIPEDNIPPTVFTCDDVPANETAQWVLRPNNVVTISMKCGPTPEKCDDSPPDLQVSRPNATTSVLTITNNHEIWLGNSSVLCAAEEHNTNLFVCVVKINGRLSIRECPLEGPLHIVEDRPASITCDGLLADETAYWTIETNSSATLSLRCRPFGKSCYTTNPDFQVSRPNATTSVLTITNNHREWLGHGNVTCATQDNTRNFVCSFDVLKLEKTPGKDKFPAAAVWGGVAAAIVVVIIVVVVVFFCYKRRSNGPSQTSHRTTAETEDYEISTVTPEATPEAHPRDYNGLQMCDVGITSTYSELGTDYEIPP